MGRGQEPTGDYGYDLAHQDVRPASGRQAEEQRGGDQAPAPAPAQDDPAGDYGYDEAHDF